MQLFLSRFHLIFLYITVICLSCIISFALVKTINNLLTSSDIEIWVEPVMQRIGLTDPSVPSKEEIKLYGARGEYEAFQVAIKANKNALTNVNFSVSDLINSSSTINASMIGLYREHYVYIKHSTPNINPDSKEELLNSNSSLGEGWYADGLIPFTDPINKPTGSGITLNATPFNVNPDTNQVILVDIFIPRDAEPGLYSGKFVVSSDQGIKTGDISLQVWDFQLPLKPSLNSAVLLWDSHDKSSAIELLKHKLMPVAWDGSFDPSIERELIDDWGLKSLRLPFWSGADMQNNAMTASPPVVTLQKEAEKHQSDLFLYVYSADEIDGYTNLYEPLKQWSKNIHQAGLFNLAVMTPVPELYDDGLGNGRSAIDVWVVSASMYDSAPDRIAEVMKKGDQVWFYTATVGDVYSPKWLIDFSPINFRIAQGFINQSLGLTGILYWRADLWTEDPWNNVQSVMYSGRHYPGDGMLVYPGKQVGVQGVVPSLRLKWIREGIEDYEYIQLLKNLGSKTIALNLTQQVGKDWKNWVKDPDLLDYVRQKIGSEISRRTKNIKS